MMIRNKLAPLALVLSAPSGTVGHDTPSVGGGSRKLAFEWLAGYEPTSLVTDYAAIDLDQVEMEKWLAKTKFQYAEAMYELGGHSQPISRLHLIDAEAPSQTIPKGAIIWGWNAAGDSVQARLHEDAIWTDSDKNVTLYVEYLASPDQANYINCQVGGLVLSKSANHDGCLNVAGYIQILDFRRNSPAYHFKYEYDNRADNINGRTIQKFSTDAVPEMMNCSSCPHDTFSKFVDYYGVPEYGDTWIQAAFGGHHTKLAKGNADFKLYERPARAEGVKIASKFMNVWMHIVHLMDTAVDQCGLPCDHNVEHQQQHGNGLESTKTTPIPHVGVRCGMEHVWKWDQAVAYYVGSLEGEAGLGDGVLMFDLADTMCELFRTCGQDGIMVSATSFVNNQIITEFTNGKTYLEKYECEKVAATKERIISLMTVPLIQATLYYAHEREFNKQYDEEKQQIAEIVSASYAATVLPLVNSCSKTQADVIYTHLGTDSEDKQVHTVNFENVKRSFEHTYSCLGITCHDVGGIWKGQDGYAAFASPCQDVPKEEEMLVLVVWVAVLAVVTVVGSALYIKYRGRFGRGEPTFELREATHLPELPTEARELD